MSEVARLEGVRKTFRRGCGPPIHAVNGVSLSIGPGETLGLIGESGSGKSTVGRLALGLHLPDDGRVEVLGRDLATLGVKELRRLRSEVGVVFQEPFQSLDPSMTIARIVDEPLAIHAPHMARTERRRRVVEALDRVALGEDVGERYPRELSGGQQQRVGIARAIVTRPKFIVLDEPTSSLDLSVRAQVLELLADLQRELGLSYLFISHDIRTVEYVSRRVAVMYLGQIVEVGSVRTIFEDPRHPYTRVLLASTLSVDPRVPRQRVGLKGEIPSPTDLPSGCFFHGRCPMAVDRCRREAVALERYGRKRDVACLRAGEAPE